MKKIYVIITIICFGFSVNAQQNLVPNGSFEQLDSCYDYIFGAPILKDAQVNLGLPGYNCWYIGGKASPDYFAKCANQPGNPQKNTWSTPANRWGYQKPYHGDNYAGIANYVKDFNGVYTEMISTNLLQTLQIGQKYYVSLKVSLADSCNCATSNLAVTVRTSTASYIGAYSVNAFWNSSLLKFNLPVSDSLNWTVLSGSFVADSNYKSIIIGNPYSIVDSIPLGYTVSTLASYNQNKCFSYYYIDDIKLSTDSNYVYTSVIENINNQKDIIVYPNPTFDFAYLKNYNNVYKIEILDYFGNILIRKNNGFGFIDLTNFCSGIYLIKVIYYNNTQKIIKLIKTQ